MGRQTSATNSYALIIKFMSGFDKFIKSIIQEKPKSGIIDEVTEVKKGGDLDLI